MRVVFETHGCRLNRADTEALQAAVVAAGHELSRGLETADVYVLNGCTITHQADADARNAIRRARRDNPGARVVVTGCYANAAVDELRGNADVGLVLGNADKPTLPDLLGVLADRPLVRVSDLTRRMAYASLPAAPAADRSRAHLKVQDGCNYRCSFCIVPRVRGRSRSIAPEIAAEQLRSLVRAGVPEIVVTGVHLGTWGLDLGTRGGVGAMLQVLLPHVGGSRLRLGSLDPHEVDDNLIQTLVDAGSRACRHLHLPVQSGDAGTLKGMRRAHGVEEIERVVQTLTSELPGIALGSDVIVGFPGESEAAFDRSYSCLESLPFSYLHVFTYSRRAGTEADALGGQVDSRTKTARSRALRDLSRRKWGAFRRARLGCELDLVLHRTRHPRSGRLVGLSSENIKVEVDGTDALLGRRVRVVLDELDGDRSLGRLVD